MHLIAQNSGNALRLHLCLDSKYVDCFKYNFVLILFYHTAKNHKLDGNWKIIKCYVIHFLNFAGMLPVIFGIFSQSSHFCQAHQKRKLHDGS